MLFGKTGIKRDKEEVMQKNPGDICMCYQLIFPQAFYFFTCCTYYKDKLERQSNHTGDRNWKEISLATK